MSSITNLFVDLLKQVFIISVFLFKIPFLWLEPSLHLLSGKKDRPMPKYSDYIIASKYTAWRSPTRKTFSFRFEFPRYSPTFENCSGNSVFGSPLYFKTATETTGVKIAENTEFSRDALQKNPETKYISTKPRRNIATKDNMSSGKSDARKDNSIQEIVEDCSIQQIERVHFDSFASNQPLTSFGSICNDNVEARRSISSSLKISRSASGDEKKAKGKVHKKYNRRGSHKLAQSKKASPSLESPPITEIIGAKRANTY